MYYFNRSYETKDLIAGLARLPENFAYELCPVCQGSGKRERSYSFDDSCYCCQGFGIYTEYGYGEQVPHSIINQVLMAANMPPKINNPDYRYKYKENYKDRNERLNHEFRERLFQYQPSAKISLTKK